MSFLTSYTITSYNLEHFPLIGPSRAISSVSETSAFKESLMNPLWHRIGLFGKMIGVLALLSGQALARGAHPIPEWSQAAPGCGDPQQMVADRIVGQGMAKEVFARAMPWAGARVNEYVSQLGQILVRSSGSGQAMSFRVLYSHEINALALRGGFIFINSAAITGAESEGELAYVLAHEIAHLNNCDWRRTLKRSRLLALLSGAPFSVAAESAAMAGDMRCVWSAPFAGTRVSRTTEQEADRLALVYMGRAGYDPGSALKMLDRLEAQEVRRVSGSRSLSAGQADISSRRRRLESLLARLPSLPVEITNSSEFKEARDEILCYDESYARVLGMPLNPDEPPRLLRRPLEKRP